MIEYLPVFVFFVAAIVFALGALVMSRLVHPRKPGRVKSEVYECGIKPLVSARERLSIRFYIIALLFVVFDVEAIFLFPWAILYDQLLIFGLIEMGLFLGILIIGYFYAWKKRALEWV